MHCLSQLALSHKINQVILIFKNKGKNKEILARNINKKNTLIDFLESHQSLKFKQFIKKTSIAI